jgi:hypothetical protein
VAGALGNLARMFLIGNDPAAARRLLEEAVPYHQAALKASPDHLLYRRFYRITRWRLAEAFLALGDHAAAAAATREFLAMAVEPPRDAYTAGCLFAGCIGLAARDDSLAADRRRELATAYGAEAVAALRQAVEKGAKEVAGLKTDPKLDPLRAREDFRKLAGE